MVFPGGQHEWLTRRGIDIPGLVVQVDVDGARAEEGDIQAWVGSNPYGLLPDVAETQDHVQGGPRRPGTVAEHPAAFLGSAAAKVEDAGFLLEEDLGCQRDIRRVGTSGP